MWRAYALIEVSVQSRSDRHAFALCDTLKIYTSVYEVSPYRCTMYVVSARTRGTVRKTSLKTSN